MQSLAYVIDLKDDPSSIAEYESFHKQVWPEVLEALRSIGIGRMEIFRAGNRLFMYCSVSDDFDPEYDLQKYTSSQKAQEWDELMRKFQCKAPSAGEKDWWASAKKVFDTEWNT